MAPWLRMIGCMVAAMLLAACGVKRPLIAPKDIPAHDAKRQKDMEKYHTDDADAAAADAAEKDGQ